MNGASARGLAHRWVNVHGLRLHCVEAGTGPLVVLLHGFPEFWYAWRHQIPALADAGFRVVAPDLPGYNTSDKPPRVRDYRPTVLVQDLADLIVALGAGSAAVAGHDWGGALAWLLAMQHPELIQRLVVLNAPHPIRFLKGLGSPRQLRRSWYILAFQLPWLPERLVAARDFQALRRALRRQPARPGAFTAQDIDRYVAAAAQPGALRAAINYYRATFRTNPLAQVHSLRRVDTPTLIIWGDQDPYLGRELAEPDRAWVPNVRVERILEASHWVQADAPERVNQLMVDFLLEPGGSWELLDALAVAADAYRKADPAPRSTSTTDRALPSSAVQFRRGRMSRGSERMRTTSAVSIATSVPAPIAIPRSDCASAGASFTPYRVRERSARVCA